MDTVQTPNVFINPPMPSSPIGKKVFNPKFIFVILGAVVLLEVVIGVKTLLLPSQVTKISSNATKAPVQTQNTSSKVQSSARLTLESPQKEYKVGENIPVSIKLDTGGKSVDGVDIVLKFNPKVIEASSSSVTKGTLLPDYPVIKVENGVLRVTAISSLQGQSYSGSGIFATIIFKALQRGKAQLSFDFTKDATTDTNVVGAQTEGDMLQEVRNLEVNIK